MKIKVDLSKFKLKKKQDGFAHLEHKDGHQFKVRIDALHPMNRKNLDSLEMHQPSVTKKSVMKSPNVTKEGAPMADGGDLPSPVESDIHEKTQKPMTDVMAPPAEEDETEKNEIIKKYTTRPKNLSKRAFADGGDAQSDDSQPEQPPVTVNVSSAPQPSEDNNQQAASPDYGAMQQQLAKDQAASQQIAGNPQASPQTPDSSQQSPQSAQQQPAATPDTMAGYQKQVGGIQQQAEAESQAAQEQEAALKGQAKAAVDLKSQYDTHYKNLDDERKNFQQDVISGHIDPTHYLGSQSTGQRIGTAIGLFLGGLGGMGHGNQALDFLNKQIDRDIEAQKANLGKKETLLSANMRQFGNLKDATEMTRLMSNDAISAKLQEAAAKSASPLAKARAQQMLGQLEQQTAPVIQTLAMRQMLAGGQGDSSLEQQDPVSFVPFVVPENRQKDVTHEIGQAQNAAKNTDAIMEMFDQAAKENTVGGRIGRAGFTPPSILGMRAMMLPLIHDLEGRVNEFEQKTTSDLEPAPFDKDSSVAYKRDKLLKFLQQKSAAPNAKQFGIDLEKFRSTSPDKAMRLPPQQKLFADWARKNPNDPRAQAVLKKLGLQ